MIAYRASNPLWPRVRLRVLAYHPSKEPQGGPLRVVVQVVDREQVVAEDPILACRMTELELLVFLNESREQGWELLWEDTSEYRGFHDAPPAKARQSTNHAGRVAA